MEVLAQTVASSPPSDPLSVFVGVVIFLGAMAVLFDSTTHSEDPRHKKWREANKTEKIYFGVFVVIIIILNFAGSYILSLNAGAPYWDFYDRGAWIRNTLFGFAGIACVIWLFRIGFRGTFRVKACTVYLPLALWVGIFASSIMNLVLMPLIFDVLVGVLAGSLAFALFIRVFPAHEKHWTNLKLNTKNEPFPPTPIYQFGFYVINKEQVERNRK